MLEKSYLVVKSYIGKQKYFCFSVLFAGDHAAGAAALFARVAY